MGVQKHYWFHGGAKKEDSEKYSNKLLKKVTELRPNQKISDCELWMSLMSTEEVEQWILSHGEELPKKS
jgi:hypothetical protein